MQPDQIKDFENRLNQWVASQGFWFQLHHSLVPGGIANKLSFLITRISIRLGILLLILAIIGWVQLIRWSNSPKFRQSLEAKLRHSLAADSLTSQSVRSKNQLEINKLNAVGNPDTFFQNLTAHNIRCRMSITDGLIGVWKPSVISIGQLNVELNAGADNPESAANIAKIVFSRSQDVIVDTINVARTNLQWGYSTHNMGSVSSSKLRMNRIGNGWKITLTGGTFSQNWLKNLDIIKITIICEPDGLFFEDARLRQGSTLVDFSGLRINSGTQPEIKGFIQIDHLDLESVLSSPHHPLITGTFSSRLSVSGSTNTPAGIAFEGTVTLDGKDSIMLHDRIHVLKALSVIDYSRKYNRVEFTRGSFSLKSASGTLELKDIDMQAPDLLSLKGNISIRPPSSEEIASVIRRNNRPPASDSAPTPPGIPGGDTINLLNRFGLQPEMQELELKLAEQLAGTLRYQGQITLFLAPGTFEDAPRLAQKYPPDPLTSQIPMPVPIDGYLHELTIRLAESVYEDGKR